MSRFLGPLDSWYQPPEPPGPCCALAEDDENHDVQSCLDGQAEAAAEDKAERQRDEMLEARYGERA